MFEIHRVEWIACDNDVGWLSIPKRFKITCQTYHIQGIKFLRRDRT